MPYDQNVNMNDVYAPAQTNIIIRSQSERNVTASDILSSKQARKGHRNHQRVDLEKFTGFLRNITRQTSTQKCAKSIRIGLSSTVPLATRAILWLRQIGEDLNQHWLS